MPNIKNIDKLTNAIRETELEYLFMGDFVRVSTPDATYEPGRCGTFMCIAGWANHLRLTEAGFSYEGLSDDKIWSTLANVQAARKWLGLSLGQAHNLFFHTIFDLLPEGRKLEAFEKMIANLKANHPEPWQFIYDNRSYWLSS